MSMRRRVERLESFQGRSVCHDGPTYELADLSLDDLRVLARMDDWPPHLRTVADSRPCERCGLPVEVVRVERIEEELQPTNVGAR